MGCVCNGDDTKKSLVDWNAESSWSIEETVQPACASRASQTTLVVKLSFLLLQISSPLGTRNFISMLYYPQCDAFTKPGVMNNHRKWDEECVTRKLLF